MRIRRFILVEAEPSRIWPLLVEPENIIRWCDAIQLIRATGEIRAGIGATFHFEERAAGRMMKLDFVVTEWIADERVAFDMTAGNLVKGYSQRYLIEKAEGGSLVSIFEEVKLPYGILGRIAGVLRRSKSEALLDRMLANLKRLAETSHPWSDSYSRPTA